MKRNLTVLCLCAFLVHAGSVSAGNGIPPESFVRVQGTRVVAPDGREVLLRGTNVGNWLLPEGYMFKFDVATAHWQINQVFAELVGPVEAARFWRRWYDTYITQDDFREIKALGMDHVRVPFNSKLLMPEDRPGTYEGPGWELLDRAVAWGKAENLYVILDMHGAPCGQTGTNIDDSIGYPWLFVEKSCQDATVDLWREIANRYKDETIVLGYDLLNEPIPHYDGYAERFNALLEPLYKRIVAAVREVDPNHIVVLGGSQWNSNFSVFGKPFDDKLIYQFHKYWTAPTDDVIKDYVDFRAKYNVPLWMGESGENNDAWVKEFRQTLERNKIGWAFWPYKKMDAGSNIRTFDRPAHWDAVIEYQKMIGAGYEDKIKARPSPEVGREALDSLIENVRFANSRRNPGYIDALGLGAMP